MEMQDFFEKLNADARLRSHFFEAPMEVAAEHEIKFNREQTAKIRRLADYIQVSKELAIKRIYPDPVFYPVEILIRAELTAIGQLGVKGQPVSRREINPVFYPVPFEDLRIRVAELEKEIAALRSRIR